MGIGEMPRTGQVVLGLVSDYFGYILMLLLRKGTMC